MLGDGHLGPLDYGMDQDDGSKLAEPWWQPFLYVEYFDRIKKGHYCGLEGRR